VFSYFWGRMYITDVKEVLRKVYGCKKGEVSEEFRILHNK